MKRVMINDVFFIEKRLKEISKDYYILFNLKTQKFEIHSKSQTSDSLCLVVPYEVLDERTITLVNKTKIENMKKIIEEIDSNNEKVKKEKVRTIKNELLDFIRS